MNLTHKSPRKTWKKRIILTLVLFNFSFCLAQASEGVSDLVKKEKEGEKTSQMSPPITHSESELMLLPEEILIAHILPDCDYDLIGVNHSLFTLITGYSYDQIHCEGFEHRPASKAVQYPLKDKRINFRKHINHIKKIPSFVWYSRITEVKKLPLDYWQYLEGTHIRTLKPAKMKLGNVQENVIRLADLLANNTTVTALNLWENQIDDAGAQVLALNTTLTTLHLGSNQVGAIGAQVLALNTTLTTLHLGSNQVGAVGAQALANNTSLTELDLTGNNVGVAGAQALALNTTLTSLNLDFNEVGDAGVQYLACNTTLTALNLWNNQVGDAGARYLACNTTLTTLNLWTNQVGDAGVQALALNTTLTQLNLSGNLVTEAGKSALNANTRLKNLRL